MTAPDDRRDDFPPQDDYGWARHGYRQGEDWGDLSTARGIAIAVVVGLASLLLAVVITCGFGFCGR